MWRPFRRFAELASFADGCRMEVAMTEQLHKLVELARSQPMTPEEREEQLRNFVAGNVGLENARVTRAVVDEAAKRIAR